MANTLYLSGSINLWTELKKVKLERKKPLFEYFCSPSLGYYEIQTILELVGEFEEQMNVTSTELIFTNITTGYLETAAEMFIYLIICPRETENWYDGWLKFHRNLLETESLDIIILSLNRLIKTTSNTAGDILNNEIGGKLFDKITTLFSLHYKDIQSMLFGNNGNTSFLGEDSALMKGLLDFN